MSAMDHDISMDEIPDPFWELSPPLQPQVTADCGIDGVVTSGDGETGGDTMEQSPSMWSFERFLEEELLKDTTPMANSSDSTVNGDPLVEAAEADHTTMMPMTSSTGGDPMEYSTILKRKLEEDLAAVAMWRASSIMHPEHYGSGSRNQVQNKSNGEGPVNHIQNTDAHVRLVANSSSREPSPSDDDDMYGEVEILGFKMPDKEKMKKRKESNRESARRSRHRKAAHLKDLEEQVAHLRVENSALLKHLATLNQKYNDSTIDNRVLRADMETLRAKVKMAEDVLKRVVGMSSSYSTISVPTSSDASAQIRDNIINYFTTTTNATDESNFMRRKGKSSMQPEAPTFKETSNITKINRIASHGAVALELLQKRLSAVPTSSGAMPQESASSGE